MSGDVMVFAPIPQLTITVEDPGDGPDLHLHPGGQGVWQARMISALGVPVTLCSVVGGEVGFVLEALFTAESYRARTVTRASSSGWYVHDRRDGSRTVILEEPGSGLSRHDLDELYSIALAEGLRAGVSLLSGPADPSVVSPEVYRRLASDLRVAGGRVVVDLSRDHLRAVLDSGVSFLKVSHEELLRDGWITEATPDVLRDMLFRLRDDGADSVVISRADQPSLALLDDRVYEVDVPRLEAVDPRGAGDSMTAGVAAVLAVGGSLEDAVRVGAAAGALNVTRHGLGSGRADAVQELVTRVQLRPLDGADAGSSGGALSGDVGDAAAKVLSGEGPPRGAPRQREPRDAESGSPVPGSPVPSNPVPGNPGPGTEGMVP